MKQKLLLKSMLLLFALIAGSSSVWADDTETVTPTNSPSNGFSGADHFTYATGGSGTATAFYATYVRLYANNTLTITPQGGETIKGVSISATWNQGGKGDNAAYPTGISSSPEATLGDATPGTGSHTITWSGSTTGAVVFTINGSKGNLQVTSITVTYTGGTKTDPTITFNDGSVRVGKTLDLSTLFTSNSAGAVTYSITAGDSYATIDGSTLTGVAEGNVTVQASQVAAGAYNAKTVTATITVTDPALSSIAITTAPTTTTYDEGDLFDATGMVITATFADASTEDVTASCTWAPNDALETSDTEVTISYTYKGVTKTATQAITVNEYDQPTVFDIALNNTLFGTSYGGTASGITDDAPVSGKYNKVNVIYAGAGNHYINNSQIRFYPSNKLTFEAPAGYIITKIVFTSAGTWAATIKSDKGTYTSDTKTWAGVASTVVFTGSGSSRCDMSKAAITLSSTVPVTIASSGYSTIAVDCGLDCANLPSGLKAYKVSSISSTAVTLEEVTTAVAAGTGLILEGTASTSYTIPVVASGTDISASNYLHAAVTATILEDGTFYILKGGKFCLVTGAADEAARTVPAGKAYLLASDVTSAPGYLGFDFGGETTGINAVNGSEFKVNGEFYNLAGQRVAQPTKGLYIVNGKKVIIK